jgi:hypothetical protein
MLFPYGRYVVAYLHVFNGIFYPVTDTNKKANIYLLLD